MARLGEIFRSGGWWLALLVGGQALAADELLVRWRDQGAVRPQAVSSVLAKARVTRFSRLGVDRVRLPAGADGQRVMEALQSSGAVIHVEPNYHRRPYLRARAAVDAWPLNALNLPVLSGGGEPVTVAILDDSFDLSHPQLQGTWFVNAEETPNNGVDDDGNGHVDDVSGWDVVAGDPDPSPSTPGEWCSLGGGAASHGTMVAGAAAQLIRAYPDLPVRLLPLRIGCGYTVADELAAVDYILANRERFDIRLVNMSYGGPAFSVFEQDAVKALADVGILVVTAAGNFQVNNDYIPDYPSSLPQAEVVAVAAADETDRLTPWSQYGALSVDLAAPGSGLSLPVSERGVGGEPLQISKTVDGTSFAAPLTAAAAAMLWSVFPEASPLEVKGALVGGARPLDEGKGLLASDGLLDLTGALNALLSPAPVAVVERLELTGAGIFEPALGDPAARGTAVVGVRWFGDGVGVPEVFWDGEALVPEGMQSLSLPLALPAITTFRRALLSLDYGSFQRHIPIEIGRLQIGGDWLEGRIRQDEQDDIQRFHLAVPASRNQDLLIELKVTGPEGVLDLAVARGKYPQLDYYSYCEGGAEPGVEATYTLEQKASLRLSRPVSGDYQLLVIAPGDTGVCEARYQGPRDYLLRARWVPAPVAAGGGCSLATQRPAGMDPLLVLLLAGALWGVARRRA